MCSTWLDDRLRRDRQPARDLLVRLPAREQAQDLDLARGQPGRPRAPRGRPMTGGARARRRRRRRPAGRPHLGAQRARGRVGVQRRAVRPRLGHRRGRRPRRRATGRRGERGRRQPARVAGAVQPLVVRAAISRLRSSAPNLASIRSVRYGCSRTRSRRLRSAGRACPRWRWTRRAGRGRAPGRHGAAWSHLGAGRPDCRGPPPRRGSPPRGSDRQSTGDFWSTRSAIASSAASSSAPATARPRRVRPARIASQSPPRPDRRAGVQRGAEQVGDVRVELRAAVPAGHRPRAAATPCRAAERPRRGWRPVPAGRAGGSRRRAGASARPCRPTARRPGGWPTHTGVVESDPRGELGSQLEWVVRNSITASAPPAGNVDQPPRPSPTPVPCEPTRRSRNATVCAVLMPRISNAVALERDVVAEPAGPALPRRRGSRSSSAAQGSRSPPDRGRSAPTRSASRIAITVCRMQCAIGWPSPRSAA